MRSIILLLGLISVTFCYAQSVDTIPANDPLIEYTGRIDFTNPFAPRFSYSGISIRASFSGTSIAMIMDDNTGQNYYNLILDGKLLDEILVTTGKKAYTIADGLENTIHEIEIFKRTEEMFGKTQFFGFIVDEGTTLSSNSNVRGKLIEYIGNSITCGYGNEGKNGGTFGPTTENHYMTYAAITSRNFNARHLAVCKSGIGIYRNYDGPAAGNPDCMTNYYTRTFLFDENPKYSFSEKPDLVCIDLGTNDFSTSGGDSAKFVSNYLRLIDTIQSKYAMPDILCLLGPMLSDPTLTMIREYMTFLADSANRKGKGNVYFFEMSQQTAPYAIDYHPTVAQHKKNAAELTNYVKSIKNWKINPLVANANLTGANHIKLEFNTPVIDDVNDFSGFTIYGDDLEQAINTVYQDTINKKIVHIWLQQGMNFGEKVNLSYSPGTIQSADSLLVGAINYLNVQNDLTETKITKGTVNADGASIILTGNKNIKPTSGIQGLTLTADNQGIVEIDSFSIVNTLITLFVKNKITVRDSVFADYTGTSIYGVDEIPLTGFENLLIKNNSTYTGISVIRDNSLNIYPNPSNTGVFFYSVDKSMISVNDGTFEVISVNGITVLKGLISEAGGQIDLRSNVSEGMYYMKFTWGDIVITKSILLEYK